MKHLITLILLTGLFLLAATVAEGQTTISVTVTLSDAQLWALNRDYADHVADTNNPAITKPAWFQMVATNLVHAAINRRVDARRQEMRAAIIERWKDLTPEQMTNVVKALPAP